MRHLLSLLIALMASVYLCHGQATITAFSINPVNPNNCSNTTATISLQLGCANYTYTGATIVTSGSNITIQLNYTIGAICLPALQYPTVYVNLGSLNSGAVTLTAETYINSSLSNTSSPINTTVSTCCGAVAAFTPSEDTICIGDTVAMTNNTTNADSVRWFKEWVFQDTAWSPSIHFDSAGYFEVSLVAYSDTCNDTAEHFIQVHPAPYIDLGDDTTICAGSSLELSLAASLSNILWSDGSTSHANSFDSIGQYWVQATSPQGCVGSDTIEIIDVWELSDVDLGDDLMLCPDSSAVLSPGANFIDYLWSNGDTTAAITIQYPGIYWVEATEAGHCPNRDSMLVGMHSVMPIVFSEDTVKCGSNTVGTFANYSNYTWSTGSTSSTTTVEDSTVVYVTVTDVNGCMQQDSNEVAVWPIPAVDLGNDTVYCPGQQLLLASNVSGANYLWSTGSTSSLIAVISAGDYWLSVTSEEGCEAADTISVGVCVGMDELGRSGVTVFPNPTKGEVFIQSEHFDLWNIQVLDMHGKVISSHPANGRSEAVSLERLDAGTYWLLITTPDGALPSLRIPVVKQ